MSKYHNQCRLVYKSGHTLLENPGDVFGDYLIDGNTKYFVVKSFAEAVTGNKRTREMVENDNFHSIEYEAWIASSTCAWLYFVNENKGADPLEKALGQAWITDRDVIELKYWGKASQGNYLGDGRLQYEECFLDTDH